MKCDVEKLSALSDGDLPSRESDELRAHVNGCENCRRELAAIESLRTGLASLPAPEPRDDAWLALSRKLAEPAPRRWSWRRWALAPAFAAAAVCAVVVWVQRHHVPSDDVLLQEADAEFRSAEAQYQKALAKLDQVVAHAEWPAPRRREFDAARAALAAATVECQKVARSQPADADAEELLFASYRKQIRFYEESLLR